MIFVIRSILGNRGKVEKGDRMNKGDGLYHPLFILQVSTR